MVKKFHKEILYSCNSIEKAAPRFIHIQSYKLNRDCYCMRLVIDLVLSKVECYFYGQFSQQYIVKYKMLEHSRSFQHVWFLFIEKYCLTFHFTMDTDAKNCMGDPISTTWFKQVYGEYQLRTKTRWTLLFVWKFESNNVFD